MLYRSKLPSLCAVGKRKKRNLLCKMNAVACIVLASVSIVTVKAIRRIPVNRFHQGTPANKQYSEDQSEMNSDEDKRKFNLNLIEGENSDKSINGDLKFTDFILEAAKILKTYEDHDLEQAFAVIDYEVWENMYKGCKSHELADIRRYVSGQLGLLKNEPTDTLRQHLDNLINIIRIEDYGEVRDMVDFVNSLYVGEDEMFIEVLLALVHRRISANIDLVDLLKYALKSIIFDHYCKLGNTVRQELMKMIKHYWNQLTAQLANDKLGRNVKTLSLVTPFIYEKRNEQNAKKRRFDTVNSGRPRNTHDFDEYGSQKTMRADSDSEESRSNHKHLSSCSENVGCNAISDESENTKDASNQKDPIMMNDTAVEGDGEIVKTFTKHATRGNVRTNQATQPEESMNNAISSKKPHIIQRSNMTIDKLIKIGTLAKEINDMVGAEGKSLRNSAMSWSSVLGTQVMEIMGDYGDIPTTPSIVKDDENGKKDILISMKAKYKE